METNPASSPTCPACGSTLRQTKEGKDAKGRQRFQCQQCARFYILAPQPRGYEADLRHQAVRLYVEGLSFRKIARILSVHHQTVINWIRQDEAIRPPAPLPKNVEVTEMDELYTFLQKKSKRSILPRS
jgi:transposase-like protein